MDLRGAIELRFVLVAVEAAKEEFPFFRVEAFFVASLVDERPDVVGGLLVGDDCFV